MKKALLWIDRFWCASSLMQAEKLCTLSGPLQNPLKLAMLRLLSIISLFCELLGIFLLVRGAILQKPGIFILGTIVKVLGYLTSGVLHNRSGIYLHLWWSQHLTTIRQYQKEFSSILNQLGLSEQEIQSISLLPQELYSSELTSYPYSRLLSLLTPLVCSIVLVEQQQYLPALLITCVGVISLPLGKHFFREFNFRQQHEQRLALSAKSYVSFSDSMQKHLKLSLRVNTISQLPLILFSLMPFLGIERSLFANYLAFTMGLSGLTGLLAFQKSRVTSQHAVKKANSLLTALSNDLFLLSEQQFKQHCYQSKTLELENISFTDGIVIKNLVPHAILNSQHSFSASIPKGEFYILQAPSGYGKSLVILSLLHLINHSGEVFFIRHGKATNVHDLSQKTYPKAFVFFRTEDLPPSARLVDLFSKILQNHLRNLYQDCEKQFGSKLNELAWNAEDNLLEQEIRALNLDEPSVFPKAMESMLIRIRQERDEILSAWLKETFEGIIHANRVFCTLSAGEQRRIINLLTLKTASLNDETKLAILDEPLANLDHVNIERQLQMLKAFQIDKEIPLLIVTHHHVHEIERFLRKKKEHLLKVENLLSPV